MDEFTAENQLKMLWRWENRSFKLDDMERYVERYMQRIYNLGGGVYDSVVAAEYIEQLRTSV